ncbi:MAG: indoleamine 2,3-dioxygenase [Myxococcales bacterium]|nr:indoleamine 2,3-dioxygenase [Myxococcales bacterium]
MAFDSIPPPGISDDPEGALHPSRGFLPAQDPLGSLPSEFAAWEEVAADLPKLLVNQRVRDFVAKMPQLDASRLRTEAEQRRAMLLLSFIAHAYVWQGPDASRRLPANLAMPWHAVATKLGRPPVLSYASYALDNWRRLEADGPIALGNLALLQNFLAGADEEWFIIVHVDIEARAAAALNAIMPAQQAVAAGDLDALAQQLSMVADALEAMHGTLARTPEYCDPRTYYLRVRPFIHGWKNHPALPLGLVYEGVAAYGEEPQKLRGETGAQSSIVPCIDALLGVAHHPDPLRDYLMEMRDYMPPAHRAFLEAVEAGPSVRGVALGSGAAGLRAAYDRCVEATHRFRALHLEFAASYIHSQGQSGENNPTDVGTGGTPFMRYLKKHRDETRAHRIEGEQEPPSP